MFDYPGASTLAPTNVTIFTGCTAAEATAAFDGIAAKVQAMFPSEANIVVVGPDADVPQPHKTIVIQSGRYTNPVSGGYSSDLGRTPNEHCHQRNDSPWGTASVFDGQMRQSIFADYKQYHLSGPRSNNDWRNVPLPLSSESLIEVLVQEILHEGCHSMGIVPTASSGDGCHNDCSCGSHYMDAGDTKTMLKRLGFIVYYIQGWMPKNENYLRFVLPQAQ